MDGGRSVNAPSDLARQCERVTDRVLAALPEVYGAEGLEPPEFDAEFRAGLLARIRRARGLAPGAGSAPA